MRRQAQAGRDRERAAVVVGEERLGLRPARDLAVLQPADEDRAEAAGADRERIGEQHARLGARQRGRLADPDRREPVDHVEGIAEQARVGGGEPAQLGAGGAQVAGDAGVREVLGREDLRAAPVRRGPDRLRLGLDRREQRLGALGGGRCEPVERGQLGLAEPGLPDLARDPGARERVAAHVRLEPVGGLGVGQPAGRAQVGQQVGGAPPLERRARAGQHAGAEPRAPERDAPVVGDGDPVAGEHLGEQRRDARVAAQQHRDVRRGDALAHQLEHLGADELRLRALAAGLEQPDGAVRRPPVGRGLEQ